MERADGFEHERLSVVPRPLVEAALTRPVTKRLVVTDAGYFPRAQGHGRHRNHGVRETIVIVCVAGSGWVEAAGVRTRVGSSTAIVIPAGLAHSYGADSNEPWTIWWCHVRGSDVPELVDAAGIRSDRLTLSLRSVEKVTALLDEISVALSRDTTPARLTLTAGIGWRLLAQLAVDRLLPEEGTPVQRVMRYLEERVDGRVQVGELAAMVGVSSSHLAALFRDATGGGVLAHHNALKMAKARVLLDTSTLTVAEIGRQVGIDDAFYFSRQFRRVHGMSPRAYRDTRKG
ncbi:AraC-like DNA-binding protein [Microbacterium halimionae]|uniref:AraC-like DNA-binding protein n=1 Tax=Microbacterium halimionae TaxID=1526413 RepID=A0A7W3PKT5_9MICO|nr:AraC family transcriptional regulator [Microbacterium halimionae]MBA8815458.1 AraC-like DNA-binding protein [Microbacterium halimionae]NII95505.1 AraC-like DNA-binding protein [Microbacterium halimionae]